MIGDGDDTLPPPPPKKVANQQENFLPPPPPKKKEKISSNDSAIPSETGLSIIPKNEFGKLGAAELGYGNIQKQPKQEPAQPKKISQRNRRKKFV